MAKAGVCSECPTKLERPNSKTCSQACRSKRARRIKRAKSVGGHAMVAANTLPEHLRPLSQAANGNVRDIARDLLKDELAPIVRESITEDVLKGIHDLVALTPRMVELIALDMEDQDPAIRQKAYSLLARYTLGNASVAPAAAQAAPAAMQVVFQLPRPGDDGQPALVAQVAELKVCQECQQEKPEGQFVGGSERCQTCHDELQARVNALYG